VDAARLVCDEAKRMGALQSCVLLNRASGGIALAIDSFAGMSDDFRRFVLTRDFWDTDPVLVAMRRDMRPIGRVDTRGPVGTDARRFGYRGPDGELFATPILGCDGWCGGLASFLPSAYDAGIERELAMLTTRLSVWCTQHGISAVPDVGVVLGQRQHRIAELAARGHTNAEIAEALGISINTVKSRLKEVFERLDVHNRTELAHVLRRLAPLQGIPAGITRYKTVTVTRAARQPSGSITTKP